MAPKAVPMRYETWLDDPPWREVGFAPDNGRGQPNPSGPKSANKRLMHRRN